MMHFDISGIPDELYNLLTDICDDYEARPPEDRADLIECIRESADLGSF